MKIEINNYENKIRESQMLINEDVPISLNFINDDLLDNIYFEFMSINDSFLEITFDSKSHKLTGINLINLNRKDLQFDHLFTNIKCRKGFFFLNMKKIETQIDYFSKFIRSEIFSIFYGNDRIEIVLINENVEQCIIIHDNCHVGINKLKQLVKVVFLNVEIKDLM